MRPRGTKLLICTGLQMEEVLGERMVCESYDTQNKTRLVSVPPSKRPQTTDLMGSSTLHVATQDELRLKPPE